MSFLVIPAALLYTITCTVRTTRRFTQAPFSPCHVQKITAQCCMVPLSRPQTQQISTHTVYMCRRRLGQTMCWTSVWTRARHTNTAFKYRLTTWLDYFGTTPTYRGPWPYRQPGAAQASSLFVIRRAVGCRYGSGISRPGPWFCSS